MTKTAPLVVIGAKQQTDISVSKGPTDIMDGIYRAKQYVKDDEKRTLVHPRMMAFDQPWQWAAENWRPRAGGQELDPAGIDRVFLGALAGCNLACDECFVGCCNNTETEQVGTSSYVEAYQRYCEEYGWCSTLRVSGGEPMLHQTWVADLFRFAKQDWYLTDPQRLLITWIDTNLTIPIERELRYQLRFAGPSTAICGCLKPNRTFIDGTPVSVSNQLNIVEDIINSGFNLFLYWPAWDKYDTDETFIRTLEALKDINRYLPLRLTVIETKKYEASPNMDDVTPEELRSYFVKRRASHMEWLFSNYHPDLVHMPSHLTLRM